MRLLDRSVKTIFPAQGNDNSDHNEDTFLGAAASSAPSLPPAPSSASGATYLIPPASFIALRYTTAANRP